MISSAELLLLASVAAPADSVPAWLADRVREAVATEWRVEAATVALEWGVLPRPLPAAPVDMRLSGGTGGGRYLVTVLPPDERPTAVSVRAGTVGPVAVSARALQAGTVLDADDVRFEDQVIWGSPFAVAGSADGALVGWEVRRAVTAGTPLVPPVIQAPRLVTSGEPVLFVWSRGGIRLERTAVAQGSARLGETIRGQAGTTRLVGVVIGPGVAHLREGQDK